MAAVGSSSVLPVIDLSDSDVHSLASRIGDACESVGFFAVVNHGVDGALIDRAFAASHAFFDLPDQQKLECRSPNEAEYPYGYERSENLNRGKRSRPRDGAIPDTDPMGQEDGESSSSSAQKPTLPRADLKETFSIGPSNPDAGMPPRRFPPGPPELRDALERYYEQMERLASQLLRLFAVALQLPSPEWFEPLLTRHLSALRILNYYELDVPTNSSAEGGDSSERVLIRAGEHTDYGALTILRSGGPGLQLRKDGPSPSPSPGRDSGGSNNRSSNRNVPSDDGAEWVNVPEIPGAFIINIGDMMQRWTNDKWVSTLHRVVVDPAWFPQDGRGTVHVPRRQSVAYFCQVNGDATIAPMESCGLPPKYPPISAREHVMNKHLASLGVQQDRPRVDE